jgi:hypothetical protein
MDRNTPRVMNFPIAELPVFLGNQPEVEVGQKHYRKFTTDVMALILTEE